MSSGNLQNINGAVEAYGAPPCPACGAAARRADARFCATCGRRLDRDYFPTDSLLASYHQQRRRPAAGRPSAARLDGHRRPVRTESGRPAMPFMNRDGNNAAKTAMAFVTYALVPYLGILFCPGALLMGGVGLLRASRAPHLGGRRASAASIVLGVLLLCVHLLLWWILYKVPEWSRNF